MRSTPIALLCTAACAILIPATALAIPDVGEHDNGFSKLDERALAVYADCWHELGADCGRNIVDDGLASGAPPSDARVTEWMATMDRWMNPPPAPVPASTESSAGVAAPTPVAPTVATSSGGYAIPDYIVQCESGGSYTAQNASGAYGAYQIMPETAAYYGCDLSTASGQDACAAEIYSDVGSSAWSCAG